MESNINPIQTSSTWDESYLLDIPMIDKQHMTFFKLFDNLLELNNNVETYDKISGVITELERYALNHFATEETLMIKAGSSDIDLHIIQHKLFISKVEDFKTAYTYKNSVLLGQMILFMRKWFLMHISVIDGKYVESVQIFLIDKGWTKE